MDRNSKKINPAKQTNYRKSKNRACFLLYDFEMSISSLTQTHDSKNENRSNSWV